MAEAGLRPSDLRRRRAAADLGWSRALVLPELPLERRSDRQLLRLLRPATRSLRRPFNWIKHLILPVVTLSLAFAAVYTRMIRAELMRAAPDAERRRAVLLFLARVAAFDFGALIGLSTFVEVTFQIPGLGRLAVVSLQAQDLVLLQSVVLYAAFLGIAASFLVDAIVAALDSDVRDEWRFVARPRRAT